MKIEVRYRIEVERQDGQIWDVLAPSIQAVRTVLEQFKPETRVSVYEVDTGTRVRHVWPGRSCTS